MGSCAKIGLFGVPNFDDWGIVSALGSIPDSPVSGWNPWKWTWPCVAWMVRFPRFQS